MKIVLADDHAVLRAGLKEVLAHVAGWEVVAEATDGFEVLTMVNQHNPDVLILDLVMPNLGGLEALHRLKRTHPQVSVLVLSSRNDEVAAREAIQCGANGYITKSSSATELELAIKAVSKGQTYISPEVCAGVLSSSGSIRTSALSELSAREREITKLLCEGKPNRDVAKLLHISARTVDSHRANILKKLGLKSNAELTQVALREGLIEIVAERLFPSLFFSTLKHHTYTPPPRHLERDSPLSLQVCKTIVRDLQSARLLAFCYLVRFLTGLFLSSEPRAGPRSK